MAKKEKKKKLRPSRKSFLEAYNWIRVEWTSWNYSWQHHWRCHDLVQLLSTMMSSYAINVSAKIVDPDFIGLASGHRSRNCRDLQQQYAFRAPVNYKLRTRTIVVDIYQRWIITHFSFFPIMGRKIEIGQRLKYNKTQDIFQDEN